MNLTGEKGKSYDTSNTNIMTQGMKPNLEYHDQEAFVLATIMLSMAQTYGLKAGIKKFGDKGEQAAFEEMKQLHLRNTFKPVDPSKLTLEEKRKVLKSLLI